MKLDQAILESQMECDMAEAELQAVEDAMSGFDLSPTSQTDNIVTFEATEVTLNPQANICRCLYIFLEWFCII